MTAQDSRAMFEARMKQSPAYKPELMKWTDGRYDFDIMESAYHGFILGMESAQPVARTPLSATEVSGLLESAGYWPGDSSRADFINGIRYAEMTHGIKQEKQE